MIPGLHILIQLIMVMAIEGFRDDDIYYDDYDYIMMTPINLLIIITMILKKILFNYKNNFPY